MPLSQAARICFSTPLITEAMPNMIIGVIAHEIGHITGGHLSRTDEAVSASQGPAMIATLGLGSILQARPMSAWR